MTVALKIVLALSLLPVLGLPMTGLWQMLVILAAWLAIACGTLRLTRLRTGLSLGIIAAVLLVRALLPAAAIEEGHNIFLVTREGRVLQDGLPGAVYEKWRQAFEERYPPDKDPEAAWHTSFPFALFAPSSDALWRPARYSRVVDAVDFQTLSDFRGGFSNDSRYNFYGNDALSLTRGFLADLPFFVMYEFSPASVGSTLFWQGTVFWEEAGGSFTELTHTQDEGRTISAADLGRRAYALHLPAQLTERFWEREASPGVRSATALSMHLERRPALVAASVANQVIGVLSIVGILALLTTIRAREYLVALSITACALAMIALLITFSEGKYLGSTYPPHGGGDDGLSHDSAGRTMAAAFMAGDWKEALRGTQDVYWDTPGLRYFRFVEKIIFGDTNLGYTASLALLPWFMYLFVKRVAGVLAAIAATLVFFLSPVGSLSFLQYILNAKLGYAEAMAFTFVILGSYLLWRAQPAWGGERKGASAFLGGLCLAGGMFLRPNLAIAVALLGLLFVLAAWRSRDLKTMALASAGLAFALWMPLHNYVYGHQFVLMTLGGSNFSITLSPMTYITAAKEILSGRPGEQWAIVVTQLSGILWTLPRLPVASLQRIAEGFMVLKLVTLAVTIFAAFRYARGAQPIAVLAWTALAAHLPMLFVNAPNSFRYAMMGWDLGTILTIVVMADYLGRVGRRRLVSGEPLRERLRQVASTAP